jgi:UDP-N-acetylglucosamine--N-acetylmuramyl-(pentapeptide) pyrophosphoryl-undecaprenol N-acetylglucosamine transferase
MAKVVIAAGGTAGHVVPAIAVADALRAEHAEIVFVGGERAESELVPAAGYALERIRVEGISRSHPLKAARAVLRSAAAVGAARRVLQRQRPAAVLGGGGYVAGPVGLAALAARIPLVLMEADSRLGLANRLLAPHAARVCLAFPIEGREGPRYVVTGRPVQPGHTDRAGARARFGLAEHDACVLVFGGSLGARSVNEAAVAAFADAPYRVLHVAGTRDFARLRAPGPHYVLCEHVTPLGPALAAADLVIARSGGSVFELAQYGLPAVLVPYPHATADHQTANARWMERAGAAVLLPDGELTPERLRAEVDALVDDPARRDAMAAAARGLARPDAARAVADEILAAASGRPTAPGNRPVAQT